jgi:hypothetical protein
MPLGVLKPHQLEKDRISLEKVSRIERGEAKAPNDPIPMPVKKTIAEEGLIGNSAKLLSETFGIHEKTVYTLKNGEASRSQTAGEEKKLDEDLLDHTISVREKIEKRAMNKIAMALRHITSADFTRDGISLREKTGAMKDLAQVVGTMTKNNQNISGNSFAQFVFIQPEQKNESQYKDIDVVDLGTTY